jgi:hypothetical protein
MRLRQLVILLTLAAAVGSAGCSCCHKHAAPAPACPQGCPPPGAPLGGPAVPPPPVPATSGYFPPVSAVSAAPVPSGYPINYRP